MNQSPAKVEEEFPIAYYNHGLTSDHQVYSVNSAESVVKVFVPEVFDVKDGKVAIVRFRVSGLHGEYATLPVPYRVDGKGEEALGFIPEETLDIAANALCSIMDSPHKGSHICERLFYMIGRACLYMPYQFREEANDCLQEYVRATKAIYRKGVSK